jgi:hypothetical protein
MMRFLTQLRLRSERGMALPLTVLVMATAGAVSVSVVQYSTSSGRTAQVAKTRLSAQTLAEAAIANAFAVLNNAIDPKTAGTLPAQGAAVPVTMGNGTATFWGTYNSTTYVWTITGFGSVPNPTGGPALTKTLTRTAQVHGLNDGATVGAWNRMFHADASTCLTIEDVDIPTPIAAAGDLCLVGSGKITGAATTVEVGDDVIMSENTDTDSTKAAGAGSGWTSSGSVVSSNNGYASTTVTGTRHGTLVSSPPFVTGQISNAVDLNGSSQYVSLPDGSVAGLTDFTISTWVKLDTTASSRRIFDFGTGTNTYMYLTPTNGTAIRFAITTGGSGSEQVITGTAALATGSWVHVAVTHIGNTGKLYVNGAQVGSSNTSMTLSPNSLGTTTQNWIGRSQSGGNYLDGKVDDFRIYNRGLSAAELTTIQSGSTTPANMLARYTFDANANDSVGAGGPSAALLATGFGFAIPAGSVIKGVEAWVERNGSVSGPLSDSDVRLLKAGTQVGSSLASGTTYTTSDQSQYYGSSSNLWGTTWTDAEINASNFGLRFVVASDTPVSLTANVDYITIRVTYLPPPTTSIGVSGTNILQAHIGDYCTYHTQAAHKPCTAVDKVFAGTIDSAPAGLTKPSIDMAFWYTNAKPGPKQACTTVVGTPPVWDNDSTYNSSLPVDDTWSEVTPTNRSYTCEVRDAQNNLLGELSWDYQLHELKIFGTIFLDGDFRFDDNGQVVHYLGRGIIYAARDIEFDELVCAGGTGTASCVTQSGGMANWNPAVNMMTVLAGDDAEFDQGTGQSQSTPSGLQGIIYAGDDCLVHENFHLSGPIICDDIQLPDEANGWPTYYAWPALGSLVEGQAYGSPNNAADYVVTAGDQLG